MNVFPNFFEPVLYLAAMGFGIGRYVGTNVDGMPYVNYIAPGLVVAAAMNGASFHVTYNVFVALHVDRTYDAITAAPVSIDDVAIGEILWAMTRSTVYGGVFFAIIVVLQYVNLGLHLLLFLPVILLTGLLFSAIGLLFTSVIKVMDLYSYYFTLFLTPLFLFSGILYPISVAPGWVQAIIRATPLFHCAKLMREVCAGDVGLFWLGRLLFMSLGSLALLWIAILRFRTVFQTAR